MQNTAFRVPVDSAVAGGTSPFGAAIILPVMPDTVERFDTAYTFGELLVSGHLLGVTVVITIARTLTAASRFVVRGYEIERS